MEELLIPTHSTELYAEYELYSGVTKIDTLWLKVIFFLKITPSLNILVWS